MNYIKKLISDTWDTELDLYASLLITSILFLLTLIGLLTIHFVYWEPFNNTSLRFFAASVFFILLPYMITAVGSRYNK